MVEIKRNYRVYLLPVFSANPYVRELSAAVRRAGVEVILPSDGQHLAQSTKGIRSGDVVHIQWIHPFFAKGNPLQVALNAKRFLSDLKRLRRAGVRIVWTVHNLTDHDQRGTRVQRVVGRRLAMLADAVIVHAPGGERLARKHFELPANVRIEVVRHGSYRGVYADTVSDQQARVELGYESDHFVFGLVGSLRAYKGADRLIEHFRGLENPSARLLLAGGCSGLKEESKIAHLCQGDRRIRFVPGFVPDDMLQIYHRACDAIVVPYRTGFTSGAIVLAQAFDRAVIAPDHGCFADQIGPEGGWTYPSDDAAQPGAAMRVAMEAPEIARQRGIYAGTADAQWSWDDMGSQLVRVYDSLHDSHPPA